MQLDEVRRLENLPALNVDFIKLGLQDVLYFPNEEKVYTPNMNATFFINKDSDGNLVNNGLNINNIDNGTNNNASINIKGGD